MSFNFIKKWFYDIDKFTYFFAIALVFLGVLMSCSASPAISSRIHIDTYHFFKKHIIYAVLFVFLMTFISMLSRISIINLSYLGFFVCLLLLCVVPFIGSNIKGSHRWFNLGFIAIQPSEFMKPFFIIMNAHFLSLSKTNRLAPFISISMIGAICGLLILQPDFGSIMLYSAIWIVQIFLGNSNIVLLACSILPLIIIIGIVGFFFFPHFHYRIVNFFTLSSGQEQYQTKKAIESIYNGGFFGKGLGEGVVKYQLPDSHTDYIFSVICEEFGIIFVCAMLLMYMYFAYRHLVSNFMSKKFDIRVIYGLVFAFVLQSCFHIGVNTNILPSKGMTLPLISYGGSSMLANAIIFGFLLAFTRKSYTYKSPYKLFEDAYSSKK